MNGKRPSLSILCVTKAEPSTNVTLACIMDHAWYLRCQCVIVADGKEAYQRLTKLGLDRLISHNIPFRLDQMESEGFIESVLDDAISICSGDYILRLDDDETLSAPLLKWMGERQYLSAPHWKFPRAHLWEDTSHYITNPPLWPDHQTRLSLKAMSGGRTTIHAGSPYGGGELAPYPILHHKFLLKSLEDRVSIADRYESLQSGAGRHFEAFSVPERSMSGFGFRALPWLSEGESES